MHYFTRSNDSILIQPFKNPKSLRTIRSLFLNNRTCSHESDLNMSKNLFKEIEDLSSQDLKRRYMKFGFNSLDK